MRHATQRKYGAMGGVLGFDQTALSSAMRSVGLPDDLIFEWLSQVETGMLEGQAELRDQQQDNQD